MGNMLADGTRWMRGVLKEHAGQTVTYRRDVLEVSVTATVGTTRATAGAGDDITVDSKIRDYMIEASDIDFGDGPVKPVSGDEIEESDGRVFKVLPVGGEPCYRDSDHAGFTLRIHTKLSAPAGA